MKILWSSRKGSAFFVVVGLTVTMAMASHFLKITPEILDSTIDGLIWALACYSGGNTLAKFSGRLSHKSHKQDEEKS